MCTSPIQITRRFATGQSRIDLVPCGKCPECVRFKQAEFAALSVHQSLKSGSLYFLTLTYRDDMLPVAFCEKDGRLLGFERGLNREIPIDWWYDVVSNRKSFLNRSFLHDGLYYTCSLRREDIKNLFKQFRVEYERKTGVMPSFSYAFFGELGEVHGRPHYHGLIYGAKPDMVKDICDLWQRKFGFTYLVPSDYHFLSYDEIGKVSNYVAKYISKGVCSRFADLLPFIERPRRISSRNFGAFDSDDIKELSSYYDGKDLRHLSKDEFALSLLKRRQSLVINGHSYPIPLSLKNKLFYVSDNRGTSESSDSKKVSFKRKAIKTPVSAFLSAFSRRLYNSNLERQLRENSERISLVSPYQIIQSQSVSEARSREGRNETASKNLLTNLKSSKDGQ